MLTTSRSRAEVSSPKRAPTVEMKTETGTIRVSTPETTALDLVRYLVAAGHLGNVITVLAELAEKMNGKALAQVARAERDVSNAQRLGYLLDQVGAGQVGGALAAWIASRRPRAHITQWRSRARSPLRESRRQAGAHHNQRSRDGDSARRGTWHVRERRRPGWAMGAASQGKRSRGRTPSMPA